MGFWGMRGGIRDGFALGFGDGGGGRHGGRAGLRKVVIFTCLPSLQPGKVPLRLDLALMSHVLFVDFYAEEGT